MVSTVLLGVWVSVRVGIGHDVALRTEKSSSFVWWVINRLAFLLAANGMSGFMLYFLQERYAGLRGERAAGPASTAMMLVGITIVATAVPSGWLADRFGKKRLVTIACILATAGMAIVLLVPELGGLYVGGCVVGVGIGLFFTASWALGTQIVPQGEAGRYLGLQNLASAGSGAIGAYIGGPIADGTNYVLVYAVYAALFLLSVLALGGVREEGEGVVLRPLREGLDGQP
jgi:MFS family permease